MTTTQHTLVSTDLDGTLLDHHNYEWQPASGALKFLQQHKIPIIFNTSKTFAETLELQKSIGVDGPLIVENGSALAIPKDSDLLQTIDDDATTREAQDHILVEFGKDRSSLLEFIQQQRAKHGDIISGFYDWSVEEIAEHTGLSRADAELSSKKLFSEPFHWLGDETQLEAFIEEAEAENLKVTKGGRFYHIQGDTNKAKPILWLKKRLEEKSKARFTLICLGDNHNDIAMLNAADIPVCVRSAKAEYPPITHNPRAIKTTQEGPAGWHEAMTQLFTEFH